MVAFARFGVAVIAFQTLQAAADAGIGRVEDLVEVVGIFAFGKGEPGFWGADTGLGSAPVGWQARKAPRAPGRFRRDGPGPRRSGSGNTGGCTNGDRVVGSRTSRGRRAVLAHGTGRFPCAGFPRAYRVVNGPGPDATCRRS